MLCIADYTEREILQLLFAMLADKVMASPPWFEMRPSGFSVQPLSLMSALAKPRSQLLVQSEARVRLSRSQLQGDPLQLCIMIYLSWTCFWTLPIKTKDFHEPYMTTFDNPN